MQCGGKLQKHMEGPEPEVFARLLRALANTKLTKPGNFRTADGSALALRCNFKARASLPKLQAFGHASLPYGRCFTPRIKPECRKPAL